MTQLKKFETLPLKQKVTLFQKSITNYFVKLSEMQKSVLSATNIVASMPNSESKKRYVQDLVDLRAVFEKDCSNFKVVLENYFDMEKRNNLPVNLQFRKIYKIICK